MTEDELFEYIKQYQEPNESFIYLWIHPELELNYLGSHHGNPNDGYIGSGIDFKEQLKKNSIEEWTRIILAYVPKDQQYDIEELFLKFYNAANNPKFLNRTNVAEGFGVGEDNLNYTHGLTFGRPFNDYKKEKEWFNSLTPEHQRRYKEWRKKIDDRKSKKWRDNNKERANAQKKEYREKNKEKIKQQRKEYREKNKEKIKAYRDKYKKDNREKINLYKRTRRDVIRRIIEMDNTYTKEYFKGMKHEEVLKIEENIKNISENTSNTLERFF